jgi:hypothetical protein
LPERAESPRHETRDLNGGVRVNAVALRPAGALDASFRLPLGVAQGFCMLAIQAEDMRDKPSYSH